jgi:hypothetical protein
MKATFFTTSTLLLVATAVFLVGMIRGQRCPPYVGIAHYELTEPGERESVLAFIDYATERSGETHFAQKRWPSATTPTEAVTAYREALSYSFSRTSGGLNLDLWCLATSGATAADGPGFPGYLRRAGEHRLPSVQRGPLVCQATKVTSFQRFRFGLGLFPPGKAVPTTSAEQDADGQAPAAAESKS